jgi:hypothetical protein
MFLDGLAHAEPQLTTQSRVARWHVVMVVEVVGRTRRSYASARGSVARPGQARPPGSSPGNEYHSRRWAVARGALAEHTVGRAAGAPGRAGLQIQHLVPS